MSCRTPNCRGPIPDPIISVRSPQIAPEPKLNCMSFTPLQEPLQPLFGGVGDIPGLRVAGDCRAREMVGPPTFNQLLDRASPCGLVGAKIFLGHWPLLRISSEAQNFDWHDRDGLIAEYALISLKFARNIGVLNHLRQPKVLDSSRR